MSEDKKTEVHDLAGIGKSLTMLYGDLGSPAAREAGLMLRDGVVWLREVVHPVEVFLNAKERLEGFLKRA